MVDSAKGTTENNDTESFSLTNFLNEYSSLFTVLGVFGAISVYFTRISQTQQIPKSVAYGEFILRLGITGSLLIFLFVSYLIQRRALSEYYEHRNPHWGLVDWESKEGTYLNLFLVPFYFVVAAVSFTVLTAPRAITTILQLVGFYLGLASSDKGQDWLGVRFRLDDSLNHRETLSLGSFGVLVLVGSEIVIRILMLLSGYSRTQMLFSVISEPLSLVFGIDVIIVLGAFLTGIQISAFLVFAYGATYAFNVYVLGAPKGYLDEDHD